MAFDLLLRGALLADGTGAPARPADVGVVGDRIAAVGDLSAVDATAVAEVLDVTGLVLAPGFVDPHSHSDLSVLVDGAQWSHLRQGFTTQLDGNCGYTFAPLTHLSRPQLDPDLVDLATWERPAVHPAGIRHVIVNGRLAVRDGAETGERAGRLLRRGD